VDSRVIQRAQRGDQDAYALVAAQSSDRLYAIALRLLRDVDAARDALQTALVQIWRDLPSLRDPERFDAWSYRIILNCCRADRRRGRRSVLRSDVSPLEVPVGDSQANVALHDELERAFRTLTDEQRAVVVLHYYRDLPVDAIADVLGTSAGTVKSRLHYARQAMRAAIEADTRVPVRQERPA
jgi:RNA polymerase sigma-70 factor (ECF subfamily)